MYQRLFTSSSKPSPEVFQLAVNGMKQLIREGKVDAEKPYLTIIDFTKPSTEDRLWVVDLKQGKTVYQGLVAHGKNSGDNWAKNFSNVPESHQSSLGFYVTGDIYTGKHGLSLRLNGMEAGINDKALERAIVIHGADYVSRDFIEKTGRLGRSLGCPAISGDIHKELINTISGQTCLFIWFPDMDYLGSSSYLDKALANIDWASAVR